MFSNKKSADSFLITSCLLKFWFPETATCKTIFFIEHLTKLVSLSCLACISAERFIAIKKPFDGQVWIYSKKFLSITTERFMLPLDRYMTNTSEVSCLSLLLKCFFIKWIFNFQKLLSFWMFKVILRTNKGTAVNVKAALLIYNCMSFRRLNSRNQKKFLGP